MAKSLLYIFVFVLIGNVIAAQVNQDLLLDNVKHFNTDRLNGGSIVNLKSVLHPSGDLIIAGTFNRTVDLDPGTGKTFFTSFGRRDIFFSRIKPDGNPVFIKVLQNAGDCLLGDIIVDNSGKLLITGSFFDSLNFSPGNDTACLTNNGVTQAFIARYDDQGNFDFVKHINGPLFTEGNFLAVHTDGTIGVTGTFKTRADFDPGPDSFNINLGPGSSAIFCTLLTGNGNYLKTIIVHQFTNTVVAPKVAFDSQGDIVLAGNYWGNTDFDPSPERFILDGTAKGNSFIARYNANGSLNYVLPFSASTKIVTEDVKIDKNDNIYMSGFFTGTVDFDPGPVVQDKTSSGPFGTNQDIFMLKISPDGYFTSVQVFGKSFQNFGSRLFIQPNNNVVLAGYFLYSADMDPGPGESNISESNAMSLIIAEYTPSGSFLKAKRPLVKFNDDYFMPAICSTPSGDCWITDVNSKYFYFSSPANPYEDYISPYQGITNGFVIKVNAQDSIELKGGLGKISQSNEYSSVEFSRSDSSGNRYICGTFNGRLIPQEQAGENPVSVYNNGAVFNCKYDKNGNIVYLNSFGGLGPIKIAGFEADETGNIYLFGSIEGQVDFDPGPATFNLYSSMHDPVAFMAKYGPAGNLIFVNALARDCEIKKVLKKPDGSFNLAGRFWEFANFNHVPGGNIYPENFSSNIFYANISTSGYCNKFWKIKGDEIQDFSHDPKGNIYITGVLEKTLDLSTNSTPFLVSIPEGTDFYKAVYLVKYDSAGNVKYGFRSATPHANNTRVRISANTENGSVIITSNFQGTFDADPGPGIFEVADSNQAGSGIIPQFIARYDSTGNLVFAYNLLNRGKIGIGPPSVNMLANGHFYLCGIFTRPSDFQIGPTEKIFYKSPTSKDPAFSKCYLAKYSDEGKLIYLKSFGGEVGSTGIYEVHIEGNRIHLSGNLYTQSNLSPARQQWFGTASEINRGFSTLVSEYNVYTSVKDGYWQDPDTWEGGVVPIPGQIITIKHQVELQGNTTANLVEIKPGGELYLAPGATLTILR